MSVSAMPNAAFPVAAAGGTLALTSLSSNRSIFSAGQVTVGVRVLTNEDVEEIIFNGTWLSQNPGTEWIDDLGAQSASDYEVQLVQSTFTGGGTFTGPTLSTYWAISATRQWTLSRTTNGTSTWTGTMTIREVADTSNSVSASVFLSCTIELF